MAMLSPVHHELPPHQVDDVEFPAWRNTPLSCQRRHERVFYVCLSANLASIVYIIHLAACIFYRSTASGVLSIVRGEHR